MEPRLAAVMLIEANTGRKAYPPEPVFPVLPSIGDRLECPATVYLNENVMKVLSPSDEVAVSGVVVGRTFLRRGPGQWVCHLMLSAGAFRPVEPA